MHTALTIAGSDPSAGAGVQADLKTFAALGVYGTCAITAVTAQNTTGVIASVPMPADLVTAQIEAVSGDFELRATRIGMLATAAIAEAVAAAIEELDLPLVVLDPVLASSSGFRLLDDEGVQTMLTELIPRARVVTPNRPEAEALSGRRIRSMDDAREAARRLIDMGAGAVVITGGDVDPTASEVVDLVCEGGAFHEVRTKRIEGRGTHGTGCTYASAVAAYLARGAPLLEAARQAQAYVAAAIAHAPGLGRGRGPLGHFF